MRDVDENNGIMAVPGKRTAVIRLIIQALVVKFHGPWQVTLLIDNLSLFARLTNRPQSIKRQ